MIDREKEGGVGATGLIVERERAVTKKERRKEISIPARTEKDRSASLSSTDREDKHRHSTGASKGDNQAILLEKLVKQMAKIDDRLGSLENTRGEERVSRDTSQSRKRDNRDRDGVEKTRYVRDTDRDTSSRYRDISTRREKDDRNGDRVESSRYARDTNRDTPTRHRDTSARSDRGRHSHVSRKRRDNSSLEVPLRGARDRIDDRGGCQ